jgi:hypothetical protein
MPFDALVGSPVNTMHGSRIALWVNDDASIEWIVCNAPDRINWPCGSGDSGI